MLVEGGIPARTTSLCKEPRHFRGAAERGPDGRLGSRCHCRALEAGSDAAMTPESEGQPVS